MHWPFFLSPYLLLVLLDNAKTYDKGKDKKEHAILSRAEEDKLQTVLLFLVSNLNNHAYSRQSDDSLYQHANLECFLPLNISSCQDAPI